MWYDDLLAAIKSKLDEIENVDEPVRKSVVSAVTCTLRMLDNIKAVHNNEKG